MGTSLALRITIAQPTSNFGITTESSEKHLYEPPNISARNRRPIVYRIWERGPRKRPCG